ncbi:alpha/beta hydrolase [Saccharopolyspora sp. K220]|nr:alpha/beta hydrolase [Saccharopolyspora soli]
MWRRCAPELNRRFEVRTVDLLGHGDRSAAPMGLSLRDLAGAVDLAAGTHVVGFSLGGLVALRLALDCPGLVRSMVVVSTIGLRTATERMRIRQRFAAAQRNHDDGVDEMIGRWFRTEWRERDAPLADELATLLRRQDRGSYLACYDLFCRADLEIWPWLGAIEAPVTAITGADDGGATPAMLEKLVTTLPHAAGSVVPGAAHLLPLERPDIVTRTVIDHVEAVERRVRA